MNGSAVPRISRRLANLLLLLLSISASSAYSYARGQDLNWDQLNYHFYLPWALFHGRMETDLAPAAIQSFFNPIPYIPFYLMVQSMPPVAIGLVLGAIHGVNYWLVIRLAWRLTEGRVEAERVWATAAATVISVASPMALSEIGTSFADILLSPLALGGLLLLTRHDEAATKGDRAALLGASLLFGAATSLKLTFAPTMLGFVAASTLGARSWTGRSAAFGRTALGCAAAFILVGGFWYAKLWAAFGNPVFPYFNAVFASPDFAPTNLHDTAFMPKSLLDGLAYPFLWTIGQPGIGEQVSWRDVRFVLLIVITIIGGLSTLSENDGAPRWKLPHRRLALFFAVAFPAWLYEFGVQRYAVPLEFALGPVFIALLMNFWHGALLRVAGLTVALISIVTLVVPDWYHVSWTSHWYGFATAAIPNEPTLYLIGAPPMSYAVPFLPGDARAVWIDGIDPLVYRGRFAARLEEDLRTIPNIRLLTRAPIPPHHLSRLARYGLYFAGDCRNLSDRAEALMVCDLTKDPSRRQPVEPRAVPAAMELNERVIFGSDHPENGLMDNWSVAESWGIWGLGTDAALSLRIDPSAGPGPLRMRVRGVAYVNARLPREAITVYANGHPIGDWTFDLAQTEIDRTVCVPAAAIYPDRQIELRFHNPQPRSPAALGLANDQRELSIGLKSVELLPPEGACR
ncbi:MAG TPA: hypothetical protein VKZ79_18065 [Alphaproteobacteria bacterium]|nr:hypothetical protein [Alphaproteobacteria bacterium]